MASFVNFFFLSILEKALLSFCKITSSNQLQRLRGLHLEKIDQCYVSFKIWGHS